MSRRVSFDFPRLQLIERKLVRNTGEKQCCQARYARHSSRVTAWLEYRGSWCKTTRPTILSLVVLGHRSEKRVFRQMWTTSELPVVQELHTGALSENVSGTTNSQLADDFHEVFHFSIDGCSTHSEVLLHADASKEGQDHLREYRWFHLRFLGFDVSRDQISETSVAFGNDLLRRTGKHSELVHGIDREATLLTLQAAGPVLFDFMLRRPPRSTLFPYTTPSAPRAA